MSCGSAPPNDPPKLTKPKLVLFVRFRVISWIILGLSYSGILSSSSTRYDSPMNKQSLAVHQFRALHESDCFVLPNPSDAGSAIYLEHLGFKALATTSAGFAFSKGFADGPAQVTRDLMLDHFREIAAATSLPVNADFQNRHADDPDRVAANVEACIAN